MNLDQQQELFDTLHQELKDISLSKGKDYADQDVLSNFKIVPAVCRLLKIDPTTPTGYAQLMVVLKLARINNLLSSGKKPSNESIQDSWKDGINYFRLAFACYMDEQRPVEDKLPA